MENNTFEEIPSPPGLPLLGNITDIDHDVPMSTFMRFADQYGPIYRLNYAGRWVVYVTDYALVHEAFDTKRFVKNVTKSNPVLNQVRHATHDGLVTADMDEEAWGIAHRVLMPAFGPMSMAGMFDDMHDISSQLTMKWARHGSSRPILVTEDFTRLAIDTLVLCAMGHRFNSYYRDDLHPFINAMAEFLAESGSRSRRPPFSSLFYRETDRKYYANIDILRQTAEEVLAARKANPDSTKRDLLQAMLDGVDSKTGKKMTDSSIIDNLITFLIAGHETTSGMLSFVFYELTRHPEAYLKVQREVDEVVGTDPVTLEHLPKLQYIAAVLRETLRLHTPISQVGMAPLQDDVLGGKYQVKKGQPIFVLLPHSHLDPTVWGDDAIEFKPERLYGDKFDKIMHEFPLCWVPFSNGLRGCIGRPFAWQESLMAVAMLFQNFNFIAHDPDYKLQIRQTLTIKPKDFYMRASLREGVTATALEHRLAGTAPPPGAAAAAASSPKAPANNATEDNKGIPINIYYGSNTGTCEALAQQLASNAAEHGFKAGVIDVMDAAVQSLAKGVPSVFLTASYEGMPPDNAALFVSWLESLTGKEVENVPFAVFGVGNHDWAQTFHRIPNLVNDKLEELGGSRVATIGLADAAQNRIFTDFEAWEDDTFWPAMTEKFNTQSDQNKSIPSLDLKITTPRTTALRQGVDEASVVAVKDLTQPGAPVAPRKHIEIELPKDATYRVGDYLAVLPMNDEVNVKRVMRRFHLPWDAHVIIPSGRSHTTLPTDTSIAVNDLLSAYVELEQPATKKSILTLNEATVTPETKEALQLLAGEHYEVEVVSKRTSLLDILEKYSDIQLPFSAFLQFLPPLRVRQYSISSSPLWDSTHVTLTYSMLDAPSLSNASTRKLGVATSYLSSLKPGDKLHVAVRPSHAAFHLPADVQNTPIIMVAAGTGLAPFRGFIQERAAMAGAGRELAPALLFVGSRGPDIDDLYRDEFDRWQAAGVVDVRRAFSRVETGDKGDSESKGCRHVQDRLWHDRADIRELWKKGARVFVCGSRAVGNAVNEATMKIHQYINEDKGETVTKEESEAWFAGMRNVRFAADVFD